MKNTSDSKNLEWEWSPFAMYSLGEDSPQNHPPHESDVCACGSKYCLDCALENQAPKVMPGTKTKAPPSYRFWLAWYRTEAKVKALIGGRDKNPWPR